MENNIEERLKRIEKHLGINPTNEFKKGDLVKYKNYEFYVIETKTKQAICVTKDCLSREEIEKHFENYDYDYDVKFSTENSFDWVESNIRKGLDNWIKGEFDLSDLIAMKTNYVQDKYSEDYARLLTVREIEGLPMEIRKVKNRNCGYWSMSPYLFNGSGAHVFIVAAAGGLSSTWVSSVYGVRPVIALSTDLLRKEEEKK